MIQAYCTMYMAVYGCIRLYTAVYSHTQIIQKVDFCIQIIWIKRYLDEMVLDDMEGTMDWPLSGVPEIWYFLSTPGLYNHYNKFLLQCMKLECIFSFSNLIILKFMKFEA